jgi:hypothetical protein
MREQFVAGGWVILQNCHLGLKFMEEIDSLIQSGGGLGVQIHEDFRLWITTQENPRFPLVLLQKTLKVTNEPPKVDFFGLFLRESKLGFTKLSQQLLLRSSWTKSSTQAGTRLSSLFATCTQLSSKGRSSDLLVGASLTSSTTLIWKPLSVSSRNT